MNSQDIKRFLYDISQLFFQWSLIYLLVLFFLEDLKPFLVSSQFSPHWLILPMLLSAVGMLRFAKYGEGDFRPTRKRFTRFDAWLLSFLSVIISLLWFVFLQVRVGILLAFFLAWLLYFLVKKITIKLINN